MVEYIQCGQKRYRSFKISDKSSYEYLLGAYHGDGTTCQKNAIIYTIDSRNVNYITNINSVIRKAFNGIDVALKNRIEKNSNVARVVIYSSCLYPLFNEYKKDGIWKLPDITNIEAYLAGVIDTDGCIMLKKNTASCIIVQKNKENIYLLSNLFNKLGIKHKLLIDYSYNNYLGNFTRSELIIRSKKQISKILDFPYLNYNRILKVEKIKEIYKTLKEKRQDGELESLILKNLDSPKTISQLIKETKLTSGNIGYKILRMKTIKREKVNKIWVYSKV